MSLKSALRLISVLILAVLLCVIGVGAGGLSQVSRSANEMGVGKDVVADILPPPLFLIESQLTVYDLASSSVANRPFLLEKLEKLHQDYDVRNNFWSSLDFDAKVKAKLLGEQKKQGDLFWSEVNSRFLPALRDGNQEEITDSLKKIREHYEAHKEGVAETVIVGGAFADDALANLERSSRTDTRHMYLVGGVGIVAIFVLMKFLSRWLSNLLGGEPSVVAKIARAIAEGHLDVSIPTRAGDSSSVLATCSLMQETLKKIMGKISVEATNVANGASQLSESAQRVAVSSTRQAESTSSAAAAVEELTVSIGHVSNNANDAHQLAVDAGEAAVLSSKEVKLATVEVAGLASSIDESASCIRELSDRVQQIGNVTTVIRDVADQTNLLALNAAIEAARAGESGRGFAVVADEVRKLAERTTQSVLEISSMISAVQSGAIHAVESMENSKISVTNVVSKAGSATVSMEHIQNAASLVEEAVVSISGALSAILFI